VPVLANCRDKKPIFRVNESVSGAIQEEAFFIQEIDPEEQGHACVDDIDLTFYKAPVWDWYPYWHGSVTAHHVISESEQNLRGPYGEFGSDHFCICTSLLHAHHGFLGTRVDASTPELIACTCSWSGDLLFGYSNVDGKYADIVEYRVLRAPGT
jgi:hypothetical protein